MMLPMEDIVDTDRFLTDVYERRVYLEEQVDDEELRADLNEDEEAGDY